MSSLSIKVRSEPLGLSDSSLLALNLFIDLINLYSHPKLIELIMKLCILYSHRMKQHASTCGFVHFCVDSLSLPKLLSELWLLLIPQARHSCALLCSRHILLYPALSLERDKLQKKNRTPISSPCSPRSIIRI